MRMNWTRARHRQRTHQRAPRLSTMIHHSSRRSCRAEYDRRSRARPKLRRQAAAAFLEWRARQKER